MYVYMYTDRDYASALILFFFTRAEVGIYNAWVSGIYAYTFVDKGEVGCI